MQSLLKHQKSQDPGLPSSCTLWPADLKLTHLDWDPKATLIHFQGQYLTICELDYNILRDEIRNTPKTYTTVDVGEFCLVEDVASANWYRGRVQNRKDDLYDIFLVDHGNVLSTDKTHMSSSSKDLFNLPPKIVCGFLANVMLLPSCPQSVLEEYFTSLVGRNVTGYNRAMLPYKVLLFEMPEVNNDLVRHGFGRHVDTDTFLFLVEMLTEVPLKQNMEPVPDLLIEKPRVQEFCFKPSIWHRHKDILSFCRPRLSCGTHVKVRITAAVNPKLFYCQMASMKTDLLEMSKKLNEVCENAANHHGQKAYENLGILCSVKSKDGKWYRGFVPFLPINSQVRVLFIDYGYFESVKVDDVYRLPPELFLTPIMAFPCSLSCLNVQDDIVKNQQLKYLKAGLLGRVLGVEICDFDEEQHLYNINLTSAEDDCVTKPECVQEPPKWEVKSALEMEDLPPQGASLYHDTVMGKTFGKTLEEEEVQVGSVFVGYVEHIQNPNQFWIRSRKRNDEFEEMMTKMADHFSQVKMDKDVLKNPELGSLCCAVYEADMHFYRAVVIDLLEHGAEVLFIDFGNVEKVPRNFIKNMPEAFASKPPFAICCTLDVYPVDDFWTSGTSDIFRRAVSNKALLVRVVHARKSKFLVDLGCDEKQSITDFLIAHEHVECWNSRSKESNAQVTSNQQYSEEEETTGGELKISPTPREQGLAKESVASTKQVPTLSPESFVYSSFGLTPGKEEQVYVTHVSSQSEVFCHLERNSEITDALGNKILEESEKIMQASTRAVMSNLCLAKYFDGKWYRGMAHPVQSPLHHHVFFVDYGNENICERTQVKFLPRDSVDLLYTPMQGMRFHLLSVSKDEFCADAKEWLESAALNKEMKAIIRRKNEDGSFDVELFEGDVNINEKVKDLILSLKPQQKMVVSVETKTKPKVHHKGYIKTPVKIKSQHKDKACKFPMFKPYKVIPIGNSKKTTPPLNAAKVTSSALVKPVKNSTQNDTSVPQLSDLPKKNISTGSRAKCFVSHINSVHCFYLHLADDESAILKLVEGLNSDIVRSSLKTPKSLRINNFVLAEYEEDGALYRSVVEDCKGDSSFVVEFVDYGNTAVVAENKICLMPKMYLSQPRFSICCSLLDSSTFENNAAFTAAVMEKPLVVEFVQQRKTLWDVKIQVLSEDVDDPVLEESPANKNEEDIVAPASSSETKQDVTFCKQEPLSETEKTTSEEQDRMSKSERATFVKVENDMQKTQEAKPSNKTIVKTCRRRNGAQGGSSKTARSQIIPTEFVQTNIQAKDQENATILSVHNIGFFYVRLARTMRQLAKLEAYLTNNLCRCDIMDEKDLKPGVRCLAQVQTDNKWHRAAVQEVAGEKCSVFLVDHGITEEIPKGAPIRRLSQDFIHVPNLAVRCKVNCIGFSEGESVEVLLSEALKFLIGKDVNLVFVRYSEVDQLWTVEIVNNGQFQEAIAKKVATQNKIVEKTPDLDTSPPQQLHFAPIDLDKEYLGFATAVVTPSEFYVVLEDLLLTVSALLDNLPEQLSPLPEAHLLRSTCCLFKSDAKNKWCRAEIVDAGTTLDLNLVDYGHCECVSYEDRFKLKSLPEELTKLPKVTYPCMLRGVKPTQEDKQWTDEAAIFFQECLHQKNLWIVFRESVAGAHWKVDILADGIYVSKELVDAGHGSYLDTIVGLRFQEQIHFRESDDGKFGRLENLEDETEESDLLATPSQTTQCALI